MGIWDRLDAAKRYLWSWSPMEVTWEVRAGDAWHRFAVLDPESLVDIPKGKASGVLDIFT